MSIELASIRRAMGDAPDREITFHVIGVGKRPAQRSIDNIVRSGPEGIILVGFCGGADPGLTTGDLHVPLSFRHLDTGASIPADHRLTATLTGTARLAGLRCVSGTSTTVDTVAGPSAKTAVFETTGAATVNMEDYWAAGVAHAAGVPFASLRSVLDSSRVHLPPYITDNSADVGRMVAGVIMHPGRVPAMLRLACLARTAGNSLTACLLAAIDCLAPRKLSPPVVPR